MQFLGEKLRKVEVSWEKYEVEVSEMETKTNKALEALGLILYGFFLRKVWICSYGTSWGSLLN